MSGRRGQRGAVYLACWARTPYGHAGHYLGYAYPDEPGRGDEVILAEIAAAVHTRISRYRLTPAQAAGVAARIAQHRAGRGARLMAVIADAGIGFTVTRVWAGATEGTEKWLKDLNNRVTLCPACSPGTQAGMTPGTKRYRRRKARREPQSQAA